MKVYIFAYRFTYWAGMEGEGNKDCYGLCTYTFDTPIFRLVSSKRNCSVQINWIYVAHNVKSERVAVRNFSSQLPSFALGTTIF